MLVVFVKENSWIARFAAYKLHSKSCAIVFNRTIHLYNVTKTHLLQDQSYLRHEVAHVKQWQLHGLFAFTFWYIWYSIRHGYYNNPFEKEARLAEQNAQIMEGVIIL